MKIKIWQRTSFWAKIVIAFNLVATSIQGALEAGNATKFWHWFFIILQLVGNIIAIFNEDKNKNDVPDLLEEDIQITSTTTTTFKKDEIPKSETETTIEIKPKENEDTNFNPGNNSSGASSVPS